MAHLGDKDMTGDERRALKEWLREHGIEPGDTPMAAKVKTHPSGEVEIDQFTRNSDGTLEFDPVLDRPVMTTVVVRPKRPLPPWRPATFEG